MDDSRLSRGETHISVKCEEGFKGKCYLEKVKPSFCPGTINRGSKHSGLPTPFANMHHDGGGGLNSVCPPCLGTEAPSSEVRH